MLESIFGFFKDKEVKNSNNDNEEDVKKSEEASAEDCKLLYESISEPQEENQGTEKICLTCGKIYSPDTLFCKDDGTKLIYKDSLCCPKCGKSISLDSRFCQNCGYDTSVLRLALSGNPEYQNYLGVQYGNGEIIPQNFGKAFYWLKKSNAQGNTYAIRNLGIYYQEIDPKQSFYWLKKSAEGGNVDSQYDLGWLYTEGKGTAKNVEEAIFWFKEAAKQNHADAAYALSNIYIKQSSDEEKEKAFYWLEIASKNGSADADELIASLGYIRRFT